MNKLVIFLLAVFLLAGCGEKAQMSGQQIKESNEVVNVLENVTIVDKEYIPHELKGGKDQYYIIVESNGQQIKLKPKSEQSYELFEIGTVATIGHSENNFIQTVTLERE